MPRSSARGYVEPIAAIAAVFALGVGLTLYAGTVQEAVLQDDRGVAATVLSSLQQDAATLGVLEPRRLRRAAPPANWSVNLTLATADGRWTRGVAPPPGADAASTRVAVRRAPGRVVPGRLEVVVWR